MHFIITCHPAYRSSLVYLEYTRTCHTITCHIKSQQIHLLQVNIIVFCVSVGFSSNRRSEYDKSQMLPDNMSVVTVDRIFGSGQKDPLMRHKRSSIKV